MAPYIDMSTSALAEKDYPASPVSCVPPDTKAEAKRIGALLLTIPFFDLILFCLRMFFALFFATILWVIFWYVFIVVLGNAIGKGGALRSILGDIVIWFYAM